MNAYAHLLDGLTLKRAALVTLLCVWASGITVWFFINTYFDLLVSALCVGYTCMVLFTVATNLRQARVPQWVLQVLGIVAGSFLGTVLAGVVKGRDLSMMFSERLFGVLVTMGLGIGFGCMVLWVYIFRERESRHAAQLANAEAMRHQLEKNVLEARLALMQAQVEPHFLFNTLANVQHLVETDPPAASQLLESLIQYLRAALPRMREDASTVGREAEMARAFLEIHRMRMGSRLDFEIDDIPVDAQMRGSSGRTFLVIIRGTPYEHPQSGFRRTATLEKAGFRAVHLARCQDLPVLLVTSDLPDRES